jgi:hypothetical protein
LSTPPGGNEVPVGDAQGGEHMYIGVGTIVAILLIIVLIAFVF